MSALDDALDYAQRGWAVIPVPFRSKNPGFKGWEQLRVTRETATKYFNGQPQNIGVLLGEPSGWLIDVDLDHLRAVELAPQFLPATPAIFGRSSKPRSHWIYRVSAPVATKKFRSKSAGMLVELRSTGMQTVFPPSTHECGESISWDNEDVEPATIEPSHLLECVQRLADAVKVDLGERQPASDKKKLTKAQPRPTQAATTSVDPADRSARCLAAMLRIRSLTSATDRIVCSSPPAERSSMTSTTPRPWLRSVNTRARDRFQNRGMTTRSSVAFAMPKGNASAGRHWRWTPTVASASVDAIRSQDASCFPPKGRCRRRKLMSATFICILKVGRCNATPAN